MGLVVVNTTISLDGFVAGPNHEMDWVFDHGFVPDEPFEPVEQVIRTTGAILTGRNSYEVGRRAARSETSSAFGGRWSGPEFVLTHNPPADKTRASITFLTTGIRDAVGIGLDAAKGRNLLVLGASVAKQAIEADLVDEIFLLMLPITLGDGIPLFGRGGPGGLAFETIEVGQWGQAVELRFRRPR